LAHWNNVKLFGSLEQCKIVWLTGTFEVLPSLWTVILNSDGKQFLQYVIYLQCLVYVSPVISEKMVEMIKTNSGSKSVQVFNVCLYLHCRWRSNYNEGNPFCEVNDLRCEVVVHLEIQYGCGANCSIWLAEISNIFSENMYIM
jgi:hypothetical protein